MRSADASKPKYRKIFDALSRDILAGRYRPGQRFPSEAALVQRFRASRITVAHALRELQQRGMVDRVAGSGTYVRNPSSHAHEGLLFGLIIPDLGETEIFEPICQAIAASPDANGHALLWAHAGSAAADKEQQALELCRQSLARAVAGVFFAPLEMTAQSVDVNRQVMKLLKEAGIAVVLLDRRPDETLPREFCDMVGIDNHHAGFLATNHLLGLGARRIGFLAYKHQALTVKARIRGYKDALAAHDMESGQRIFHITPKPRVDLPAAVLECDALVCANDRIAGQAMHALLATGKRIPHDVRIVGIDDVNYASLLPVPLTTVHQPCREIGETALRVMLERLDRPKMPARDILLDCSLVVRESCGGNS